MQEFFIVANSFAAPFLSDTSTHYEEGNTAAEALESFVSHYNHPAGLYGAAAYKSADAKRKGAKPLAQWLCNHELEKQRLTKDLSGYSYYGAPEKFEIDGVAHEVKNPKGGQVVEVQP